MTKWTVVIWYTTEYDTLYQLTVKHKDFLYMYFPQCIVCFELEILYIFLHVPSQWPVCWDEPVSADLSSAVAVAKLEKSRIICTTIMRTLVTKHGFKIGMNSANWFKYMKKTYVQNIHWNNALCEADSTCTLPYLSVRHRVQNTGKSLKKFGYTQDNALLFRPNINCCPLLVHGWLPCFYTWIHWSLGAKILYIDT